MAFYSDDVIENVKAASDIVDVVSGYVNLKRKGNNYFGLCPFHKEKTGSFSVSAEKQIFHCFGCGEGGNVIRFIMKIENIGFQEAVEFLADKFHVTLPTLQYEDGNLSQEELLKKEYTKKRLYEINKLSGRFFFDNIARSKLAQEYIQKRGISPKTVAKFGLGFALEDNGLSKFLVSRGFTESEMLATGLVGKSESGYLYDKFKNRFMFPIFDIMNRVVAFGGRTLLDSETMKAQKVPKYVNSPENLIYTKGKHLYGLNVARKSSEKMKRILVVEGYMDVISPHQAGISNVVASLGTALTENQGRLLRKYAEEVVLSYDSDDAGQKAIMRGLEVMSSLGVSAKVLQMEGAKDPDEFVQKYGPERFEKLIDNSISLVEYKVANLRKEYNLTDISEKIRFLSKLSQILAKVDSNIERDIYVDKFSRELNVGKEAINAEIEKIILKKEYDVQTPQKIKPLLNESYVDKSAVELENMIIFLLLQRDIGIYLKISEVFSPEDAKVEIHRHLIDKIYHFYETEDYSSKDYLSCCESDEEMNLVSELMMQESSTDDVQKLTTEIVRQIEIKKLEEEKNILTKKIAETTTDDENRELFDKLNQVIQKLAKR